MSFDRARLLVERARRLVRLPAHAQHRRGDLRRRRAPARSSPWSTADTMRFSASVDLAIWSAAAACSASARDVVRGARAHRVGRLRDLRGRGRLLGRRLAHLGGEPRRVLRRLDDVARRAPLLVDRLRRPPARSCASGRSPGRWRSRSSPARRSRPRRARACSAVAASTATTVCAAARCSSVARAICADDAGDLADAAHDLLQPGGAGFRQRVAVVGDPQPVVGRRDGFLRDFLQRLDDAGDVGGRLGRAIGEVADLLGDDREAAAGVAGARRFDRRVQRQQVRPLGDQVDGVDDRC